MNQKIRMDTQDPRPILPHGTRVKILGSGYKTCFVVEYRGAYGPERTRFYGVLYRKPRGYIEVPESELEVLPLTKAERRLQE